MRYTVGTLVLVSAVAMLLGLKRPADDSMGQATLITYFKKNAAEFALRTVALKSAISAIDAKQPASVDKARSQLKACRISYKRVEFFLEYFFKSNAKFYNGPPKVEVEEPYMEWQTPTGLQVIETLLFDRDINARKRELAEQADALASSALDMPALLYNFTASDKQILESIRLEIIRVCTLGITGFDAPFLKSGINESAASFEAIRFVLTPYLSSNGAFADSLADRLVASLQCLGASTNFDSFDRLSFLTGHALPLQQAFGSYIKSRQYEMNSTGGVLNYDAPHLFSPDAINLAAFPQAPVPAGADMIRLGSKLFRETGLSGNNKISCATCHQPARHFTDAMPKSMAFNGHSTLRRNAPTLIYSGFQYEQFWDGRAKSLEAQVLDVLTNRLEMNGDAATNIDAVGNNQQYAALFKKAFPGASDTVHTVDKVAISIAAFVRTLNFRNSPFDQYMQGNKSALNRNQVNGFNLFMGKAQCGTCHFAPLFNGLVPPLYDRSELEVLGTPKTGDFNKPKKDDDRGRFDIFPINFYNDAFKTPTVRNVSATGPYMHNGSMKTLESVMTFYNKGGGAGLGMQVKNQTLSAAPLNLSESEMADIIYFLHSLEDDIN